MERASELRRIEHSVAERNAELREEKRVEEEVLVKETKEDKVANRVAWRCTVAMSLVCDLSWTMFYVSMVFVKPILAFDYPVWKYCTPTVASRIIRGQT